MFMSVVTPGFDQWAQAIISGHWRATGPAAADTAGGTAALGPGADLGFLITNTALSGEAVLGCHPLTLPQTGWALRIDEVAFPVGSIAHRHSHTGSGWRHLVSGSLRIETADRIQIMQEGDSWFEPADAPVRAVALQVNGVTRFVRCMAIPAVDIGRSTFQLADPGDADVPRLQMTHRHIDHPVQVEAG